MEDSEVNTGTRKPDTSGWKGSLYKNKEFMCTPREKNFQSFKSLRDKSDISKRVHSKKRLWKIEESIF